jgi:hypothetical protein
MRRFFSSLILTLFATVLSTAFMNCSAGIHFGGSSHSKSSPSMSGGTGLDGKPYWSYGMCADGHVDILNGIVVSKTSTEAHKVRENCQDLPRPQVVDMNDIHFALSDDSVLQLNGQVYDLQTDPAHQKVTLEFVQSASGGSQVETLIWQYIGESGTLYGSVRQSDGVNTGTMTVQIPVGTQPIDYITASGQTSNFDLTITETGMTSLSYAIGGGSTVSVANMNRVNQISPSQSKTPLHYASGNDINSNGGAMGYNLADINSVAELNALPAGAKGLVWLGLCNGVDANFVNKVTPFIGNPKLYGFQVMSDPDPTGTVSTICPPANLKAESDWIHAQMPTAKTYIVLMTFNKVANPSYANTYDPSNSGIDLFGLNPYPCRSELNGCDFGYISKAVLAAQAVGIPLSAIVPVYQAAGGFADDAGGTHLVPTTLQANEMLAAWGAWLPSPAFDHAYAWRTSAGVITLEATPALQPVFAGHNSF